MNHMMVDLETLGTRASSVIASIGAVVFNEQDGIVAETYWNCEWQSQIMNGRTVDEGTLRWWLDQEQAARDALKAEPIFFGVALNLLDALYTANNCERIWANGASFDIAILDHALAGLCRQPIWKYNAPRDMRTLRDFVPKEITEELSAQLGTILVAHNALDDAKYQAMWVLKAMKYLEENKNRRIAWDLKHAALVDAGAHDR